jgi:thiol-disulfide isomerase/thioredoxin
MSGQQQARRDNRNVAGRQRGAAPARSRRRVAPARRKSFIQQNRTFILALGGVIFAGALLVVLVLAAQQVSPPASSAASASEALIETVTGIPAATFDTVGAGTAGNAPKAINAEALVKDGKPEFFYVGGEFCPFCAAERWPMVVALGRFGTFSDLKITRSSPTDVNPNTPTFSFFGSSYESPYISFTPVEIYSNERAGNGYAKLQSLSSDQQKLVDMYNPDGGIPFLDIGGKYVLGGANFSPSLLAGQDWSTIAAQLSNPQSRQAQAIVGSANILTAAICKLTNGQPGDVCQAPGTVAAAQQLN